LNFTRSAYLTFTMISAALYKDRDQHREHGGGHQHPGTAQCGPWV
jgi:hypothetical protein